MTRTGNKMKYKAVIFDMDSGVLIDGRIFLSGTYIQETQKISWLNKKNCAQSLGDVPGKDGADLLMHELAEDRWMTFSLMRTGRSPISPVISLILRRYCIRK